MIIPRVIHGDMRAVLPKIAAEGARFHAVVTDPPYHLTSGNLAVDWSAFGPNGAKRPNIGPTNDSGRGHKTGFMNKQWDGGDVAFQPATWRAVYDALLPGGHMLVFGGTRTQHRMVCAIEDAGFEIRDTLMWVYGSGFAKSQDTERAIAMSLCREPGRHYMREASLPPVESRRPDDHVCPRCVEGDQWDGFGTGLKPSYEPIALARRPLAGTVAANVLRYGCGALNIDVCRIGTGGDRTSGGKQGSHPAPMDWGIETGRDRPTGARWPANLLHDGSDEVEAAFAAFGERTSGSHNPYQQNVKGWKNSCDTNTFANQGDTGTASRFFYSSKADKADRADSKHPTVKPVDLLRWLCQLITPPGGHILDPFAGSGTTGEAAMLLGMNCTLIDADAKHASDIEHRIKRWSGADLPMFAEPPVAVDPQDARVAELFATPGDN